MFGLTGDNHRDGNLPASSDASKTVPDSSRSAAHRSLPETTVETVIYRLCQPLIFVGREAWKVDICLSGTATAIADVHCEITVLDSEIRVSALDAAVITLNGLVIRSGVINLNDELGIGSCLLRLTTFEGERILAPVTRPSSSATPGNVSIDHQDQARILQGRPRDPACKLEVAAQGVTDAAHVCESASASRVPPSISMDELIAVEKELSSAPEVSNKKVARSTRVENSGRVDVPKQSDSQAAQVRQFFIVHADTETGPLPSTAVQQLIDAGTLAIDAPIRTEGDEDWQTCRDQGFVPSSQALPDDPESADVSPRSHSEGEDDSTVASSTKSVSVVDDASPGSWRRGCSLASRITAAIPMFLFQLVSLPNPRRHVLKWRGLLAGGLILLAGFGVWRQMNAWSHKALSGQITFASHPVADVVVTLSSNQTGQSGGGLTDRDGRFVIYTRSGNLPPGPYRVKLSPARPGQEPASLPSALSEPIIVASTSPVFTTIAADQSEIVIELRAAVPTESIRRSH